jgi:hypothetical protein
MALVEKFHVVAAERAVASGQTIKEGQCVALNTYGEVVLESASFGMTYGIAGDTKSTTASAMPGVASGWQNRVSDYFDETKASGKMTVYHSGGEFATDQFATNVASATPYQALYAKSGVLDTSGEGAGASYVVAYLTQTAGSYPSGVPGTDITGDQALSGANSNQYIEFKLVI